MTHTPIHRDVSLMTEFTARLAALPQESWERMRARCAFMDEPSFGALLARARLSVQPSLSSRSPGLATFLTSIGVVRELVAEFPRTTRPLDGSRIQAAIDRGDIAPRHAEFHKAHVALGAVLAPYKLANPGLVAAVRAAAHAVMRHDLLSPNDFDAAYSLVEPEIPFASLDAHERPTPL